MAVVPLPKGVGSGNSSKQSMGEWGGGGGWGGSKRRIKAKGGSGIGFLREGEHVFPI
jgi:hypothetical protein